METIAEDVLEQVKAMRLPFRLLEHEKVHTIQECYERIPLNWEKTVMPRNALVCNRQKTEFYLVLMSPYTPFRTSHVSHVLGVSRLSFAPQEMLPELLGSPSGALSPLGLLFDREDRVKLAMDEALKAFAFYAFHPCDSSATVVLKAEDFLSGFLENVKKSVCWVQMQQEE